MKPTGERLNSFLSPRETKSLSITAHVSAGFVIALVFLTQSVPAWAGGSAAAPACNQLFRVNSDTRTEQLIVLGVLVNAAGEVLLGERMPPQNHVGKWEFPGGKVDPGETAEQALIREIEEEMGIKVHVGEIIEEQRRVFDEKPIRILFYRVYADAPHDARAIVHSRIAWATPATLSAYPFIVPDQPVLKKIWRP